MSYQNFAFKKACKRLSYFACLLIFLTVSSCSNEKSGSSAETPTAKEQLQSTSGTCGDFAYLAISIDTLNKIFGTQGGGLNSRKIVFRFAQDGSGGGKVSIEGFATQPNSHNYLTRPPVMPDQLSLKASYPNQKIYLADLELTKTMYNNLPPPGTNTFLIFTPNLSQTDPFKNCITYRISWGTPSMITSDSAAAALIGGGELNPSPPADPGN